MQVKIVGAGGIGSHLLPPLCRYLANLADSVHIVVLDGDAFEPKNAGRQVFSRFGNKAEVCAEESRARFPSLEIEGKNVFLNEDNAFVFIREEDVIFSCVDNHPTRLLLSNRCGELDNVTLISGGNEYSDGNVQLYMRRNGKNITPPLTHLHPEIAHPSGKHPEEMSCEELAQAGSPQLIFTNLIAASLMLQTFWLVTVESDPAYTELYFDLKTGQTRPVTRKE